MSNRFNFIIKTRQLSLAETIAYVYHANLAFCAGTATAVADAMFRA